MKSRKAKRPRLSTEPGAASPTGTSVHDADDASSVAPSEITAISASGISRRSTPAGRLAVLESHPLSGEVRETEIYCIVCAKWIKLSNEVKYKLLNWQQHVLRMHSHEGVDKEGAAGDGDGVPSSRVKEAERKITLVNDAQAKEFGPHRVTCKVCERDVMLEGTGKYELTNWMEHKRICSACVEFPPPYLTPEILNSHSFAGYCTAPLPYRLHRYRRKQRDLRRRRQQRQRM